MTDPMGYDIEAIANVLCVVDRANLYHELPSDFSATYHGESFVKPEHSAVAVLGHVRHYVVLALSVESFAGRGLGGKGRRC